MDMDLIYDKIGFSLPEGEGVKDKVQTELNEFKDSAGGVPALEVILDATHGGYINRNFAFYSTEGQKKSHKSFFTPFPKPVLTEHDDGKAPIGRISDADFLLLNEDGKKNLPTSKIRLTALVMDTEAIQKILDGRYMTVSISGRPKSPPICSICNEQAGYFGCKNDHMRGKDYDGKTCYYIFDELEYSEVSFVNKPADQGKSHAASVVSIKVVEAPVMNAEAQKMYSEAVKALKGTTTVSDSIKDVTCESCGKAFDYTKVPEVAMGAVKCPNCGVTLNQEGKKVGDSEDKCVECEDLVYSDAEIAEIAAIVEAEEDADKTLTTKQRKGMKGSTFCGPNRSYPVNDCCFSGSQKVKLLDGRSVEIQEIVAMVEKGESVWTYGFDLTKNAVVPVEVSAAWLAKKDADVLEVTLDNGETITCTENHPFLLKTMDYVQADKLASGTSLMPLYTRKQTMYQGSGGYEQVLQPWFGLWEYTHRMVVRETSQSMLLENEIVHHKDENIENNTPSNLNRMDKREHLALHSSGRTMSEHRVMSADEKKAKSRFMRNRMAQILSDDRLKTEHSESISEGKMTYDLSDPTKEIRNSGVSLADAYNAVALGATKKYVSELVGVSESTLRKWLGEVSLDSMNVSGISVQIARDYFYSENGFTLESAWNDFASGSSFIDLQIKYKMDRSTLKEWMTRLGYETDRTKALLMGKGTSAKQLRNAWVEGKTTKKELMMRFGFSERTLNNALRKEEEPVNHRVVSIRHVGKADVYDLEVPTTNNFALAAGVFVHNSHGANAKARATQQVKAGKLSASAAAKIKACANRKMKSMGCGGSDALTTGNDVVDALIELVNDLRAAYETDLEALRNEGKANSAVAATKQADTERELTETKTVRDTLASEVTKGREAHTQDLEQVTNLSSSFKDEKAKSALLMSLVLKKESFLNVFSGQNAEERAESFNKKLETFRSISMQDLTNMTEELLTELTKQAIIQPASDELDPVLAGKIKKEQSKNQRLQAWFRGR